MQLKENGIGIELELQQTELNLNKFHQIPLELPNIKILTCILLHIVNHITTNI